MSPSESGATERTTFVEAGWRRPGELVAAGGTCGFTTRMLYQLDSSLPQEAAELDLATELRFEELEHSATDSLLAHLAGEVGLAVDSWALEPSASGHRGGRVSGLAFEGGRDYSMARIAIGPLLAPYSDQECTEMFWNFPLPAQHELVNRDHLVGMDLFDSWCGPGSRHKAIFVKTVGRYRAVFLPFRPDWRLGFDLPDRGRLLRSMHWYPRQQVRDAWAEEQITRWADRLRRLTPSMVRSVLESLPSQWRPPRWESMTLKWIDECDVDRAVSSLRRNLELYKTGARAARQRLDGGWRVA